MLTSHDVQIRLIDFPTKGNEAITRNEDGTYTIFLNARLTYERQLTAYIHALRHIKNNDFENDCANNIELCAHRNYFNAF